MEKLILFLSVAAQGLLGKFQVRAVADTLDSKLH